MTGLRRQIPEIAIEWALDTPERLWQAVDGTLCFADISGFTALSEKLSRRGRIGGEELVETLSRVFGGMLDAARERDGTKFLLTTLHSLLLLPNRIWPMTFHQLSRSQ